MKISKWKIWVLGILTSVATVAFVRYQAKRDEVIVRVVDKETGRPVNDIKVRIAEHYSIPVLRSIPFLPQAMCWRDVTQETYSVDGTVRTGRIAEQCAGDITHIEIQVKGYQMHQFEYTYGWLERPRPMESVFRLPVPSEGAIVIPIFTP